MKHLIYILIFLASALPGKAQMDKILTEQGNNLLQQNMIPEAVTAYQKALEINPEYKEAAFNLGNAYQAQSRLLIQKASELEGEEQQKVLGSAKELSKKAAAQFSNVASKVQEPEEVNKAQYNLGNASLMSGEVDKSISAYKEALRKNPADDDARYNLAYAQHLKKKQEQQKQQQQQEQNQDQEKQDQEKQEQEQNQDQQEQNQEQKDQPQPDQLSKEEAEKMLEALAKQEKELQEDLNKKKRKAQPIKIEKDW